jgi:FtsP/CotA-like multicopper oxidase with cupredoxin domain
MFEAGMNRRGFLGVIAAGAATAVADTAPDFTLRIGPVTVEPFKGKLVHTLGYNGSVPGPLFRVPEGKTVTVQVFNDTDFPELVHWHGLHIASEVDGSMEEGTPMIAPRGSRRYTFPATPSGTRWYHTHTPAGRNIKRATYTGQFGFFYIEPRGEAGAWDQEMFLALKEWDPYLTTAGEDSGLEVAYKYCSINGKGLGFGDPIRVKEGDRVMLRILNASATMHRRIAVAGHTFRVVAMDGNPLRIPCEGSALELGPAERIDALVEMKNPGVWILGETNDHDRKNGLGIVIEYAGKTGEPRWLPPSSDVWNYAAFGQAPAKAAGPDSFERIPLVFQKKFAGTRWVDNWTINGKGFPKSDPIRVKAGGRYRLVFDNRSDEAHPVHLHRHSFEIAKIAGVETSGVVKDVVVVGAMSQMEVDLVANNPGPTLFHCHQQLHMDFGFMTMLEYV